MRRLFLALLCATAFWAAAPNANAQVRICVEQYLASREEDSTALGVAPDEIERLVQQIGQSIGLRAGTVNIVPCDLERKVRAWYSDGSVVPAGEYLIYNGRWVREVIGEDRVQAIALFGHELGHFLNRDFNAHRLGVSTEVKEAGADRFAGCAVARMSGTWRTLEDLLSRLRAEDETSYPNRLESLEAARDGFRNCGGAMEEPIAAPVSTPTSASPIPGFCRLVDESMFPTISVNARFQADGQIVSEGDNAQIGHWWMNGDRLMMDLSHDRGGLEYQVQHTGRIVDGVIGLDNPNVTLFCRPAN